MRVGPRFYFFWAGVMLLVAGGWGLRQTAVAESAGGVLVALLFILAGVAVLAAVVWSDRIDA